MCVTAGETGVLSAVMGKTRPAINAMQNQICLLSRGFHYERHLGKGFGREFRTMSASLHAALQTRTDHKPLYIECVWVGAGSTAGGGEHYLYAAYHCFPLHPE